VDGGANFGYYTVLMADLVGDQGKVHAFEPGGIFELLKWNVEINGFANIVELHSEALHLKDAEPQYLFHDPNDLGGARLKPTTEAEPDAVETISMDELFLDKPPDFVKLDIEGSEEAAMDGASDLIAKHLNVRWLVEFHRKLYKQPQRFLNKIVAAGFELRYIDYDSSIKSITMDQLLTDPFAFWMLWLSHS
jgi:FkbM family methyltransferase